MITLIMINTAGLSLMLAPLTLHCGRLLGQLHGNPQIYGKAA